MQTFVDATNFIKLCHKCSFDGVEKCFIATVISYSFLILAILEFKRHRLTLPFNSDW